MAVQRSPSLATSLASYLKVAVTRVTHRASLARSTSLTAVAADAVTADTTAGPGTEEPQGEPRAWPQTRAPDPTSATTRTSGPAPAVAAVAADATVAADTADARTTSPWAQGGPRSG